MKMKKLFALLLAGAMTLSLAACGGDKPTEESKTPTQESEKPVETPTAPAEPIKLRLWGAEEDQTLLVDLVEKFKAAYPDQTFEIEIGVESEATAKDTILTDIEAAADVFAFASDQLDSLVAAGALLAIDSNMDAVLKNYTGKSLSDIQAANGAGSVAAASRNGTMYAFPMGGGNNYFLYYDSTKITAEQASNWTTLLDAAQAAGKKVGMTLASGWYNASFFLGAGFTVNRNEDGTTVIDWNGTSSKGIKGVDVVKSMQAIAGHAAFQPVPDNGLTNEINSGTLCAVVDGTWDADAAIAAFGEGYATAILPTFDCAGQKIQQGCFSGFKFMGVNAYSENAGWAVLLAEFLTNQEAQEARFAARQLSPTNTVAASGDAVMANPAIAASAAQDAFGATQSTGDKYWDPTKSFGEQIAQGTIASDDAAIQAALDSLVEGVNAPIG